MDFQKFTDKCQEALQSAQSLALKSNHQEVDCEHLLMSLSTQQGGLLPKLLLKLDVDPQAFMRAVSNVLERKPQVTGTATEAGKLYITSSLQKA